LGKFHEGKMADGEEFEGSLDNLIRDIQLESLLITTFQYKTIEMENEVGHFREHDCEAQKYRCHDCGGMFVNLFFLPIFFQKELNQIE